MEVLFEAHFVLAILGINASSCLPCDEATMLSDDIRLMTTKGKIQYYIKITAIYQNDQIVLTLPTCVNLKSRHQLLGSYSTRHEIYIFCTCHFQVGCRGVGSKDLSPFPQLMLMHKSHACLAVDMFY